MQTVEYRVKVPVLSLKNYGSLLEDALKTENTNIVTILQSGESDYANLPNKNKNKLHSGIQRTNKEYKLPATSNVINVITFIKNLTSKSNINPNISVISQCSNIDNIDNIFVLPAPVVASRTVVELDLTDPNIWNFTSSIVNPIIPLPSFLPTPDKKPNMFVYILFTIYPSSTFNSTPIEPVLDLDLFKAYIILLHKKMISLL
jgi:hypothetical protein